MECTNSDHGVVFYTRSLIMRNLALVVCVLLLSACGELSFKRGAGADAFRESQQACHGGSVPYADCMAQQGWTVVDMGALNPGLSVAPVADNRQAGASKGEVTAALNALAPDAVVTVASWWKFGANVDGLRAALKDCARQLGLPQEIVAGSDGKGYRVTGAQLRCMGQAGWYGQVARQ